MKKLVRVYAQKDYWIDPDEEMDVDDLSDYMVDIVMNDDSFIYDAKIEILSAQSD